LAALAIGGPETGMQVIETLLSTGVRKQMILDGSAEEAARKLVDALRKEGVI
jgi:hypothetical protein